MTKKLNKKTKQGIKENLIIALAATSLLLNLFFLIGFVTYSSTNKFDASLYTFAKDRYCDRIAENTAEKAAELSVEGQTVSPQVTAEIACENGQFTPYYDQAVSEYLRDLGY